MPIHFHNPTTFDPINLMLMGLSDKPNTTNPIGRFGTGLKYAIAGILRTGGEISIKTNNLTLEFKRRQISVREKPHNTIWMYDGETEVMLGFSDSLGSHWEPWMWYRELLSNALDEGGNVTDAPIVDQTVITVAHPQMQKIHSERNKYFPPPEAREVLTDDLELVKNGVSGALYCQGIFVAKLRETKLSFNFRKAIPLTEDRTPADIYSVWVALFNNLLGKHATETSIAVIKDQPEELFRQLVSYGYEKLNPLVKTIIKNPGLALLNRLLSEDETDTYYQPIELTNLEKRRLAAAIRIVSRMEPCEVEDFNFTSTLANNTLGIYQPKTHKIWISRLAFRGTSDLAATLLEELIHKRYNLKDGSRGFQDFLLSRLIGFLESGD